MLSWDLLLTVKPPTAIRIIVIAYLGNTMHEPEQIKYDGAEMTDYRHIVYVSSIKLIVIVFLIIDDIVVEIRLE